MKLGWLSVATCVLAGVATAPAYAGGVYLPGSGAVSASRAGAAVASADDGEALSINPAGLAKATGLTITVSIQAIRYFMDFTRRGTYDTSENPDFQPPYAGQEYDTVENDPEPPLGIAKFQPIPVVAIVSDLWGKVPGLHAAIGLYAPSAYPFRDMTAGYKFPGAGGTNNDVTTPPPASRYDILTQESRVLLPSIAASYRILPELDVGARFTAGSLQSKTQVAVWGTPNNVAENVTEDSLFTADIKDGFIPAFGIGVAYRPTPYLEIGANYSSPLVIKAKGDATSVKGEDVDAGRQIGPVPDEMSVCDTGGTMEKQKACISLQLPQTVTVGARYKFVGPNDQLLGDVELNVGWENWGKRCDVDEDTGQFTDLECTSPGQYRVVIDSGLYVNGNFEQALEKNYNNYGLKDVWNVRLGGSYQIPLGDGLDASRVIVRGGVGYDTAAAEEGWQRAALDGAARATFTLGGAYKTPKWAVSAGFGYVHEGENTNPGANADGTDCNPTPTEITCGSGTRPLADRQGPDPTNPLIGPAQQTENPYNQGTFNSHYLMLMLGFTTWL